MFKKPNYIFYFKCWCIYGVKLNNLARNVRQKRQRNYKDSVDIFIANTFIINNIAFNAIQFPSFTAMCKRYLIIGVVINYLATQHPDEN